MNEFLEIDPILAEICAELAKKPPEPKLVFLDEYCTSQCEFFNVCKANHDACIKCEVDGVLKTLSDRESQILKWRCGYEGKVRTQKDLAADFCVTTTRIQEIERKALRKLRHPSRIKYLQPFLYTALSQGKDNCYARFFTKIYKLNPEQIQNILNNGPFVVKKKENPQHMQRIKEEISPSSGIEELGLSIRAFNCLWRAGFQTVDDLLKYPSEKFLRIRNLGRRSLSEVCAKLKEIGFQDKASEIEQVQNGLFENKNE